MSTLAETVSRQSRRKKMRVLLPLVRQAHSILDVGADCATARFPC